MNSRVALGALFCLGVGTLNCTSGKNEPAKSQAPNDAATQPQASSGTESPELLIPVDTMPKILSSPVSYPEEAKEKGQQGIVYIKARIGKDGKVAEAALNDRQQGLPLLENAALEAVRQWTFTPGMAKGEPVEVWIVVPVNFRLQ